MPRQARSRLRTLAWVVALLLALVGSWGAGAVVGAVHHDAVTRLLPSSADRPTPPDAPASSRFDVFWEAWATVNDEYLHRDVVEEQRLTYGAIRGMVQSLGDPNTLFQTPDERQADLASFTGRFQGIGAFIDARDGQIVITAPIEGSPAERAGVQPGDVVLAVDGQSIAGLSTQQVVARVRGPKGTVVALTLLRAGASLELRIERDEIPLISARGRVLEPEIGLLRITSFTERTDDEVASVLEALDRDGTRAMVLDLRGNPGGLLEPAVAVASRFVGSTPIVYQENARGDRYAYDRRADRPLVEWPMIVLVDRGSASASEVLAAALRDTGRAELVGQRTYGKGTVQYLHELSDGAGLRVTAARWISPGGQRIDREGLLPDVVVDEPRSETDDPVMSLAVQHMRASIARG